MTVWTTSRARPPDLVTQHMHELEQCCSTLHSRVGQAVAEAIRETVAGLSRDAVDRLLALACQPQQAPPTSYGHHDDYDPWQDEPYSMARSAWPLPAQDPDTTTSAPLAGTPADLCMLTWAVAAARWWLGLQGSLLGACGVGLATGTAVAVSQRWAPMCQPLLKSVQQLLQAQRSLAALRRLLSKT